MRVSSAHLLFLASQRSVNSSFALCQSGVLAFTKHWGKATYNKRDNTHFLTQRYMTTKDTMKSSTKPFPTKVALLQFKVTSSKDENHAKVKSFIKKAVDQGATMLVLPEIWNGPYATSAFASYAEILPSVDYKYTLEDSKKLDTDCPSAKVLFEAAMENNVFIIGGSIAEKEVTGETVNIFNTCLCISPDGTVVGKHRKVHLFDIDVPGGITFKESDTLSPGNVMTSFSAGDFGPVGVGICYDIRFPEYAMLLTQKYKCNLLIYPGAFNMTTGPAHWELLQRARAVDNQCFVLTASPARTDPPAEEGEYKHYTAWGHSTVINPWGEVIGTCGHDEDIVMVDLDINEVSKMREGIPTFSQKRHDMYKLSDA
jgi:omega-amidase